ncbi:MAG TPA: response regulator, partial [Geobacterales bacterium]|nr:response regulator [Geobacterales bacterium]
MHKVLLVEDEKKVLSFIKRGLEDEQFEVETASDGEEGYRKGSEGRFDLIVLDVMMPKKDGLTVVKELREKKILTPVLMLT